MLSDNMDYTTARKLRDAGYPQRVTTYDDYLDPAITDKTGFPWTPNMCYIPTLEDLTSECSKLGIATTSFKTVDDAAAAYLAAVAPTSL